MVLHSLRRTSEKGTRPFIGTCVLCGQKRMTSKEAMNECPNQRGLTSDEAVIEAIKTERSLMRNNDAPIGKRDYNEARKTWS